MILLVCGSRTIPEFDAEKAIVEWINQNGVPSKIVHGGCRGPDQAAGNVGSRFSVPVHVYTADWAKGRRAGPERNERMIRHSAATHCLALCDKYDLEDSRGTFDCVTRCRAHSIPVWVVDVRHGC